MIYYMEKHRLGLSFVFSVLVHCALLLLFALILGYGAGAVSPDTHRFVVEFFEQPGKIESEQASEENNRLASQSAVVEKETVPKKTPRLAAAETSRVKLSKSGAPGNFSETARNREIKAPTPTIADEDKPITASLLPPAEESPTTHEAPMKQSSEDGLPTMADLIPSYDQVALNYPGQDSSSEAEEGKEVSLNTTEFKYISYFSKVREKIKMTWRYPEAAKNMGLKGKLTLRFTVSSDGSLTSVRVIKSSGFPILDDEAVKAVVRAAPYNSLPYNFGKNLNIVVDFEYQLNYYYIN